MVLPNYVQINYLWPQIIIEEKIKQFFPNVDLQELAVLENPDSNEITVQVYYSVVNTGIEDELTLTFN